MIDKSEFNTSFFCPSQLSGISGFSGFEYMIQNGQKLLTAEVVEQHGETVIAKTEFGIIEDRIELCHGIYKIRRTWKIHQAGQWRFHTVIRSEQKGNEMFIPSVMYRCNNMGKGIFPRGGIKEHWSFMEDRIPIPSFVLLYNDSHGISFCTEPASDLHSLSSVKAGQNEDVSYIQITVPGCESPFVFSGKTEMLPAVDNDSFLNISENQLPFEYSRSFYLSSFQRNESSIFRHYRKVLEALNDQWVHDIDEKSIPSWEIYFHKKLEHLLFLIETDPVSHFSYIKMGKGNDELQKIYDFTSSSFLVKSLEGAWALAKSSSMSTEQNRLCDIAENIGRFFLQGERAPGIHQDNYDIQNKLWGGYLGISENNEYKDLVNARCNGETMKYYVKLYRELLSQGRPVREFLELPQRVARFYLDHQLAEGSFGRWWSKDGRVIDSQGSNGAYIVSFLIELEPYFDDPSELNDKIIKAGKFYASLVDNGDFYGDTLDADAYDKESAVAFMSMFLDLYEHDGNKEWLKYAEKSAENTLSWIWQYNSLFPLNSPLSKRNFQTSGMTSVSVAHHHLDFYGIAIAYDFLRYWEYTEDSFYKRNAIRMMNACRQLLFYNSDLSGKGKDFSGWQPEQINHTDWDYFDRKDRRKGHYDIDIAWVTVLGLSAYLSIETRFPEVVK